MTNEMINVIEETIEYLDGQMMLAINDLDLMKAQNIGQVIDWLKIEKNKEN